MLKLAFSTVACPDWTIEEVAERAEQYDFDGVELRTFGDGGAQFACEPALTGEAKLRRIFGSDGLEICSLGSSLRFDEPVWPPAPLGYIFGDFERPVKEAKPVVNLASAIGCPLVRVFGCEGRPTESRKTLVKRISERLKLVCDHARHTGVSVAFENNGDFGRAEQAMEVIEKVNSPLLGCCYSLVGGMAAGDDFHGAIDTLGSKLMLARVKDLKDGRPVELGEGDLPCREFVETLRTSAYTGWLVYEWDAAWIPDLQPAEEVLPQAAATLGRWSAEAARAEAVEPAGV